MGEGGSSVAGKDVGVCEGMMYGGGSNLERSERSSPTRAAPE